MNTQLFIKKDYTNLVLNPRFSPTARQYWETIDENSNSCGSMFDILNTGGLHLGIPDAVCQWAAGLLTVNQVFYPNDVSYIQRGTKYNVKVIIDNLSQPDPLNPWYIKVNLGGNDSIELSTEGYHSFQVVSGQGTNVSLIAFNFEDSNIGLDITYFEITEDRDYEIELKETESIPLTFNIADIKDPSKRKSSFSKSIKLPGTKGNNRVFGHFFEIDGESKFNPAKKLDCYLMQDGFVIFDGILQLDKVIRLNGSDSIEYEITLSGNLANIYKEWSDLKLNELDFSEFDHAWSRENQIKSIDEGLIKKDGVDYQSWNIASPVSFLDTFYDVDGYLGLDFGVGFPGCEVGDTVWIEMDNTAQNPQYNGWFKVLKRPVGQVVVNQRFGDSSLLESGTIKKISPKGEGYCYPRIHYGDQIGDVYKVTDLFPAVYAKQLIDTAFNAAEFSYTSDFFDSDLFRSLIVPGNAVTNSFLTAKQITDREYHVEKTTTQPDIAFIPGPTAQLIGEIVYDEDATPGNFNPNGVYNTSIGRFTAPFNGNYQFTTSLNLSFKALPDTVPAFWGNDVSLSGGITNIKLTALFVKNILGVTVVIGSASHIIEFKQNNFLYQITDPAGLVIDDIELSFTGQDYLLQNETISTVLYFEVINTSSTNSGTPQLDFNYFNNGSGTLIPGNVYITVKDGIQFNTAINSNLIEGEGISLNTVLTDVKVGDFFSGIVRAFNLLVFPDPNNDRNLFIEPRDTFYTSDIIDWTDKLDISKDLEIIPLAAEAKKKYVYKYKSDGDFWNKNYQDSIKFIYGEYQITTDTDFNDDESTLELIFSPTPLVGRRGNPVYTDNLILSRITKDLNSNEIIKSNIRLLYLGGQRIPANSSYGISTVDDNTIEYPVYTLYAGHLDQPLVPTVDLNFWQPFWTYFKVDQWSTGNLFNVYHRNQLLDTIDRDAKLITAYFYLLPSDIKNLDFRKQIFVDGSYYRLNKITDYNGATPGLTKVELIRFNSERPPFVPTTKPSNGGIDIEKPDTTGPTENRLPIFDPNGNQASNAQQVILDNSFDNIVDSNANKITFVNSNNNRIIGNRTNVVLINSDNLTIDEDNVTYIDGIKQSTLLLNTVQTVTGPNVDNTDPQNPVVDNELTSGQQDAIDNANAPDASNPLATMNDIPTISSDYSLVINIVKTALAGLITGVTVNPKAQYRITDAVGSTAIIRVYGKTTATIDTVAFKEGSWDGTTYVAGSLGTYNLGTDTFTAVSGGAGATTFITLTDVPSSYTSQAKKQIKVNDAETGLEFFNPKGSINLTIDGSGGNIVPGDGGCVTMPYSGVITGWEIMADVSGSIVIDVWKDTYANYPPTIADTIAGTEKPTLSSQIKNQLLTLSSWTTAVSEGDIIKFNVDSSSTVNKVYLTIYITKTS